MKRTLLLIFAALALMIGSFVWFVSSWDRDAEQSLSRAAMAPQPYQTHTGPISKPYGVL